MKKTKKRALVLILALSIFSILIAPLFGETSASYHVSCRMPLLITLENGNKVLDTLGENLETSQTEPEKEVRYFITENNSNLIEQQEKIVSEENKEVALITTVCAK